YESGDLLTRITRRNTVHHFSTKFGFGDEVTDLTRLNLPFSSGTVLRVSIDANSIVYTITNNDGLKFIAKEGALQLTKDYLKDSAAPPAGSTTSTNQSE